MGYNKAKVTRKIGPRRSKQMNYRSTRDPQAQPVTSAAAIIKGLAPDGGLFVPSTFPQPSYDLAPFTTQPYQAIAQQVLTWFFPDLAALPGAVQRAYGAQWDDQLTISSLCGFSTRI